MASIGRAGEGQFVAPKLTVEGDIIAYVADSVVVNYGFGKSETRTSINGDGTVLVTPVKDLSETKGKVSFKVRPITSIVKWINDIKKANKQVTVELSETVEGALHTFTMSGATLLDDPDVALGKDGEIELTFEGSPLVVT